MRNEGVLAASTALLYHVNFGAPTVLPGTRVSSRRPGWGARALPFGPIGEGAAAADRPDDRGGVEYDGVPVVDGVATARLRTPGMDRDVELTWTADTLPRLCQWVFPTRGGWALALEPGNAPMWGRTEVAKAMGPPFSFLVPSSPRACE